MVSTGIIIQVICVLFMQLISVNCGYNESHISYDNEFSLRSGRIKRSLYLSMPRTLKITLTVEGGKRIYLIWKKQKPILVNEHLPVNTPWYDSTPHIMENVGGMVMYYDEYEKSAVVFFEKLKALYGFVGLKYFIRNLPYQFDKDGNYISRNLGGPYVIKHGRVFVHEDPFQNLKSFLGTCSSQKTPGYNRLPDCVEDLETKRMDVKENDDEENTKRFSTTSLRRHGDYNYKEYYLEILVFVTHDISTIFKNTFEDDYLTWMVRHFIIYFNAINMLFSDLQKKKKERLNINLARIVIEDEHLPFEFMRSDPLKIDDITEKLMPFFNSERNKFPPDSFDSIFIITSRPIFDKSVQVNGFTKYGGNMYEAKKNNILYSAIPFSVVQYRSDLTDYFIATQKIARQFNVYYDTWEKGTTVSGQCSSIMQKEGPQCRDCLKWSDDSQRQFDQFLSKNSNTCFFLNKPRSLYPPGANRLLSLKSLCRCLGKRVKMISGRVRWSGMIESCDRPFTCASSMLCAREPIFIPLDGTQCNVNKVCWNEKCVEKTYAT